MGDNDSIKYDRLTRAWEVRYRRNYRRQRRYFPVKIKGGVSYLKAKQLALEQALKFKRCLRRKITPGYSCIQGVSRRHERRVWRVRFVLPHGNMFQKSIRPKRQSLKDTNVAKSIAIALRRRLEKEDWQ